MKWKTILLSLFLALSSTYAADMRWRLDYIPKDAVTEKVEEVPVVGGPFSVVLRLGALVETSGVYNYTPKNDKSDAGLIVQISFVDLVFEDSDVMISLGPSYIAVFSDPIKHGFELGAAIGFKKQTAQFQSAFKSTPLIGGLPLDFSSTKLYFGAGATIDGKPIFTVGIGKIGFGK